MKHPKFIIKQAKSGHFYFNLTAKNGRAIASSEMFTDKSICKEKIEMARIFADSPVVRD